MPAIAALPPVRHYERRRKEERMGLSVEDVLGQINAWHKARPLYKEKLWSWLIDNRYNRAQLKELARQYGIIPMHNHNYHGRLYVVCPDPKWRSRIAEVCYEEGTGRLYAGGKPHWQLYMAFCKGLGLSEEETWRPEYIPAAVTFRSYYSDICGRNFLEGVSAHMLGGEAMAPGTMSRIAAAFKEKHGLNDAEVEFFIVHDTADADHSNVGRELMDQFAPTERDRELVLKTVKRHMGIAFDLYDAIHAAAVRAG
jgi:pyrroloquinoline-quinone synthase